jgi:crossover junction endonuclease EME1
MEPLQIDTREWSTATGNVIKFIRKVQMEWDEEGRLFLPCEEYRKDEEWCIHWLDAEKFIELTVFDITGLAWEHHLKRIKDSVPGGKVLIVLEGLSTIFNHHINARNRAHLNNLRGGADRARTNPHDKYLNLNVEDVQDMLIKMQLVYDLRVTHTSSPDDSAEWISILAVDIASIPYRYASTLLLLKCRRSRLFLDRTFCMEVGQVKSGTGAEDTFHKMLQHVRGVTPQVADSIVATFKSVPVLIRSFERGGSDILQHLSVCISLNTVDGRCEIVKLVVLESGVLDRHWPGRYTTCSWREMNSLWYRSFRIETVFYVPCLQNRRRFNEHLHILFFELFCAQSA